MTANIDRGELVDIRDVVIDVSKPKPERILEYRRQVRHHPYVMCNGVIVTQTFTENGPPMDECLRERAS
jgi:hypothetical protein